MVICPEDLVVVGAEGYESKKKKYRFYQTSLKNFIVRQALSSEEENISLNKNLSVCFRSKL